MTRSVPESASGVCWREMAWRMKEPRFIRGKEQGQSGEGCRRHLRWPTRDVARAQPRKNEPGDCDVWGDRSHLSV